MPFQTMSKNATRILDAVRSRLPRVQGKARPVFVFLACAALYAIGGTVFASLLAWSLIVVASAGIVIAPTMEAIFDPERTVGLHTFTMLGVVLLMMVPPAAIGFAVAPFVGAWIGWKSALIISVAMAMVCMHATLRRHAVWLSFVIGAAGAFMTPVEPVNVFGNLNVAGFGIHAAAGIACFLVTLIDRDWFTPHKAA